LNRKFGNEANTLSRNLDPTRRIENFPIPLKILRFHLKVVKCLQKRTAYASGFETACSTMQASVLDSAYNEINAQGSSKIFTQPKV
jgi:hypothetical protein